MLQDSTKKLSFSIVESLNLSINKTNRASLVVSGGSSPIPLFNQLSKEKIDWSKVDILLCDDRVVASNHKHSNEGLVRKELMINFAKDAHYISIKSNPDTIIKLSKPFDVSILGIGLDGHFASLFQNLPNINDALNQDFDEQIIFTDPIGTPKYKRVTMNLSMILNSKRCILLACNKDKLEVVSNGITNQNLPIHYLLNQDKVNIEIIN